MAMPIWRRFDTQLIAFAFCLADVRAGNSNAARIAMMAMTTRSSMSVNPTFDECFPDAELAAEDERTSRGPSCRIRVPFRISAFGFLSDFDIRTSDFYGNSLAR